ncbi:uronyl 2-sulfotransferase-like isoform X2 [Tigriopus californicus]|uniref:uronyl 2-sulfotransferase-like isoform X2 n=1 Tax=Tigriopus californicus TaxID=6832 RepID=UPI0027DA286A|nr:uronyl 2-sulfotransferase-like isoform X2 [Tigriopus californicus]
MRLDHLFVFAIFISSFIMLAFHLSRSPALTFGSVNRGALRPLPRNVFSQNKVEQILFYPRVPKCGSGTFQKILTTLSLRNGFHFVGSPNYRRRMRTLEEQEELAKYLQRESDLHGSIGRTRHVFFINFKQFNLTKLTQVSLIRDPVQRFISVFHWRRVPHLAKFHFSFFLEHQEPDLMTTNNLTFKSWVVKDLETCILTNDIECSFRYGMLKESMSYFCGQEAVCLQYGDPRAAKLAFNNIAKHFSLVGLMEQYENFLQRAEHLNPLFFKNGLKIYQDMASSGVVCTFILIIFLFTNCIRSNYFQGQHKRLQRVNISQKAMTHLQSRMKFDFDLYYFVKQHFRW